MPNWCACNYAVRAEKKDLEEFVNLVNSMPDAHPCSFGRLWLGNLVIALGGDWQKTGCRGVIDPDPEAVACFFGPGVSDGSLGIGEDGLCRFSTVSAWDRCPDVEDLLKSKWPSMEFFWRATDEFGNFHTIHDPEGLLYDEKYYLNDGREGYEYGRDEFAAFRDDFRDATPGLDIPEDADEDFFLDPEFEKRFCEWRERENSRDFFEFYIWKDV